MLLFKTCWLLLRVLAVRSLSSYIFLTTTWADASLQPREAVDAAMGSVKEQKAWTIATEKLGFYDSREFVGGFAEQRRKRKDF